MAARVPLDRILAETDSPYLSPQGLRGQPNEPANVVRTVAVLAGASRGRRRARAADRRERRRGLPSVSVAPKKSLGQHFLADPNILGVIERLAGLAAGDVVLEVEARPRRVDPPPRRAHRARPPSSSTARSSRVSQRRLPATRTSSSTGATRSRSISPRWRRRRTSSSPTCPTTSPHRSSWRASTTCRFAGGA